MPLDPESMIFRLFFGVWGASYRLLYTVQCNFSDFKRRCSFYFIALFYRRLSHIDNRYSEWSPDIISDVTRVPDQIKLQTDVGPEQRQQAEIMTTEQGLICLIHYAFILR